MSGITITKGNTSYSVDARAHQKNLHRLKHIPRMLRRMKEMSAYFVGKPQFIIRQEGEEVTAVREDYRQILPRLVATAEEDYVERLSLSEWNLDVKYGWNEELAPWPITMHDVYAHVEVTVKTGNPYRNNAFIEFYRALQARFLGVVEAKSPIGFYFHTGDLYGERNPGKMFYRHIKGQDLERAIREGNAALLNWALWECGKFFSRLINANLYLEDSDRIGNFFIENNPATNVFRFLDLERVRYLQEYGDREKAEMLSKFIKKAIADGFLTAERLGEFVIVCLGTHSSSPELVGELLSLA